MLDFPVDLDVTNTTSTAGSAGGGTFDFDFDVDPGVQIRTAAPSVVQSVQVEPAPIVSTVPVPVRYAAATDLAAGREWGWRELRDYVIREIEQRHGPQPRDFAKETGIFKGFIGRWGAAEAQRIAKTAFEVHGGMWRSAPVSVSRFAKGSDPYFAQPIASRHTD